jgi:uncharacterized protein (TIGR03067 family)
MMAQAQEDKDDALVGEWDIVGMVYKGKVQDFDGPTGGTIKIGDGKLCTQHPYFNGPVERGMTLRPSKSPREIDLRHPEGDQVWLGIYELKDGTLRIIIAWAGDARPMDFDAKKNERLILYTLAKHEK